MLRIGRYRYRIGQYRYPVNEDIKVDFVLDVVPLNLVLKLIPDGHDYQYF